jgi:hypothetical protein
MSETPSSSLTASMANASGLSIPVDQVAALNAEQATLRGRADRLRSWLRPENEPGPLDLRWIPAAPTLPRQVGHTATTASNRAARDRLCQNSGGG